MKQGQSICFTPFAASVTLIVRRPQASPQPHAKMHKVQLIQCLLTICASWVILQTVDCKTVVMIPNPATSHTKYHTHVARALSKLGHQVWVTIPTYLSEKGYLDTSGFDIIPYETLPRIEERALKLFTGKYFEGEAQNIWAFLEFSKEIYHTLLTNNTFIRTIRGKKPDLIVIDCLPITYPLAILAYKVEAPFAFLGSAYDPLNQRIPFSPAETPINILPYSNKMSFAERLQTFLLYLTFTVYSPICPNNAVSVYAPEMPYLPLDMLVSRAEVWLVEMDHILDYPKPTLPNVKLIGGTATGPAKPLPPHFASFMDSATEGVVIVSFGSYVLDLPKEISDKLFEVFESLPMKVVFRSNLSSPNPLKIMTSEWLPQNDLLGHPNTKVFLSHCGKNGQYEALYHAVPIVAVPMFADQPYNAERVRKKGFAEVLDLKTCTGQELTDVIVKVARTPKYKAAATLYSRLFKQQYGVPMEKAAFWLDHVMEYGGDYMRSAGQEMPFYQFLMLDVLLVVVLLLIVFLTVLTACLCTVCRCLCKRKVKAD